MCRITDVDAPENEDASIEYGCRTFCDPSTRMASLFAGWSVPLPRHIESTPQAVDVLGKVGRDALPQRIQDELYPLAAGKLGRGHKVCIAGHENNDACLALEGDGRDIETDPHIDALLPKSGRKITVGQVRHGPTPREKIYSCPLVQYPSAVTVPANLAKPHCNIG